MNNIFCKELLSVISKSSTPRFEIEEMLDLYGYRYLEIIDEVFGILDGQNYIL